MCGKINKKPNNTDSFGKKCFSFSYKKRLGMKIKCLKNQTEKRNSTCLSQCFCRGGGGGGGGEGGRRSLIFDFHPSLN